MNVPWQDPQPVGNTGLIAAFCCIIIVGATSGGAEVCNVPSTAYPSVQSAIDVINCSEIVTPAGWFFGDVTIGRSLELRGAGSSSTMIAGTLTVSGADTQVTLEGLQIAVGPDDIPDNGLVVGGDAEVLPVDLVISSTNVLFDGGFERGDTTAWSRTVP